MNKRKNKKFIYVKLIKGLNTLVFEKPEDSDYFVTTRNTLIITVSNLATILHYLVMNNILSHKILEGILEDYNTFGGEDLNVD
jgi:hypothetical protein